MDYPVPPPTLPLGRQDSASIVVYVTKNNDPPTPVETCGIYSLFRFKQSLQELFSIPTNSMVLSMNGQVLNDEEKTLYLYGIEEYAQIELKT